MSTPPFRSIVVAVFLAVALAACPPPSNAESGTAPNILLIMADDIGIEGLGCYGGKSYRTPRLDLMAEEGIRFTHAYSQPLCTPTRVQIMTGKYNHRNWKYFGILDPREKTFGHRMKEAGYATGIFGKWQLQSYDPPDLPGASKRRGTGMHAKDAGFDRYSLFHALNTEDKGSRYANPTMLEGRAGTEGKLKTYAGRYGEDVWVEQIIDFFEQTKGQPTFVYYPMALPHWPFEATPDSAEWNPKNVPTERFDFFDDMVEYMDKTVGNLLDGLEAKGLRKDTLVLFYSDNGTHAKVFSKMEDGRTIRGGKATPKQTGIHVPLIAHWPGHFQPSVCDDLVDASDFVPTLLDLSGHEVPDPESIDGISFAPQLLGKRGNSRQSAFFWYDSRPGWDKEGFRRHVFALNKNYKLFRSGRLFRLTDSPLEEIEVDPLNMTDADQVAKSELMSVIRRQIGESQEPALVNAYGEPEHDFNYLPKNRNETDRIGRALLESGTEVVYGDSKIPEHRMWLFRPLDAADDAISPFVFLVHGGSWGGAPELLAPQAVYLQRRGIASAVVHFRKPSNPKPSDGDRRVTPEDTLRDVRMAYRWLQTHGVQRGFDPDRVVVSGGSAGGHLSLALSTIALEDDSVIDPPPSGFVLFNPVIDLVDGWSSGRKRCESMGIDPKQFSPAHHVTPGLPSTLILSGSDDKLITPNLIRAFGGRMKASGNEMRFVEYPGAGHGFFNYGREKNRYFQWTMWEFEKFLTKLGWELKP